MRQLSGNARQACDSVAKQPSVLALFAWRRRDEGEEEVTRGEAKLTPRCKWNMSEHAISHVKIKQDARFLYDNQGFTVKAFHK